MTGQNVTTIVMDFLAEPYKYTCPPQVHAGPSLSKLDNVLAFLTLNNSWYCCLVIAWRYRPRTVVIRISKGIAR